MAYTREDTLDTLRVRAFDCLIDLGALKNAALASYICYVMGNDPSPFVRRRVQAAFGRGLGMVAVGQQKPQTQANGAMLGEMIMEDFGVDASGARKDDIAQKETIAGAVAALKKELDDDQVIKTSLWKAVTSPDIGLLELRYLLDICHLLYQPKDSLLVVMKHEKHLHCKHIGKGVLHFKWAFGRPIKPSGLPAPTPGPPLPFVPKLPIKLITNPRGKAANGVNRKTRDAKSTPKRMSSVSHIPPAPTAQPPGEPRPKIILKLGKNSVAKGRLSQNGAS